MWHPKHFKDSPISTIVGLLMIGAGFYLLLIKENVETAAILFVVLGATAVGLKDPRISGGGGTAILVLVMLSFSSCVTYKKCYDKFGIMGEDSTEHSQNVPVSLDVDAPVKGESMKGIVTDSLQEALKRAQDDNSRLNDTLTQISDNGKMQTKFWYDKYQRALGYKSERKADTVKIHVTDTLRVVVKCPPPVVFDPVEKLPWYNPSKLWEYYKFFAAWALLVLVVALVIIKRIKQLHDRIV